MSEPMQREWCFYVTDMIGFAEKVVVYTDGMDQEKFVSSGLNYDATVHNLILQGEAASHIPDRIRTFCGQNRLETNCCHAQSLGTWLSGN
jgi:uncharacterized protein with HEPN domain